MAECISGRRPRILAIHRYYWPDAAPYGRLLKDIVGRWSSDGHYVEVLTAQPSYGVDMGQERRKRVEFSDGVLIRRLNLGREIGRPLSRILNALRLSLAVFYYGAVRGRFDVIMASTTPPVLIAAVARLTARLSGAAYIYHCMDLHPEIGRVAGHFGNPLIFNLLRAMDSSTCRGATRVVVLSKDMAATIRDRPRCANAKIQCIPNFDTSSGDSPNELLVPHSLAKRDGSFRVLFAGNLGRFQGLENVVEAMRMLRGRRDLECVFLGSGSVRDQLAEQSSDLPTSLVRFAPHQTPEVARAVIRTADLCLVTLAPGVYRFAFPSKTMTYLAMGRPILVTVDPKSELAEFVEHEGVGMAVEPNCPGKMAEAIGWLLDNPEQQQTMARRAAAAGQRLFKREHILDTWAQLPAELARS